MVIITLAAMPIQAQAFQLICTHQGGFHRITQDGKTETGPEGSIFTMAVDVDLENKKLAAEGFGPYGITSVTGVEIIAGETSREDGVNHNETWKLNRVTGALTIDSQYVTRNAYRYSLHTYKCERATAKF
jgi:hypothetical protein